MGFHGDVGGEFLDQVRRAPPHAEVRADPFIHVAQVEAGGEFSEGGHGNAARFFGNSRRLRPVASSPKAATEMRPVSSETTSDRQSVSSVMPMAARWRVPKLDD